MTAKIEWYREVLELEPNSKVFFPLARLLSEEGQTDEAINLLEKGLDRHPEFLEARLYLIELLHTNGHQEKCNAEVDNLSKMFASYAGFWQAWAACLASEQGQADTASIIRFLAAHFVSGPLNLHEVLNRGLDSILGAGKSARAQELLMQASGESTTAASQASGVTEFNANSDKMLEDLDAALGQDTPEAMPDLSQAESDAQTLTVTANVMPAEEQTPEEDLTAGAEQAITDNEPDADMPPAEEQTPEEDLTASAEQAITDNEPDADMMPAEEQAPEEDLAASAEQAITDNEPDADMPPAEEQAPEEDLAASAEQAITDNEPDADMPPAEEQAPEEDLAASAEQAITDNETDADMMPAEEQAPEEDLAASAEQAITDNETDADMLPAEEQTVEETATAHVEPAPAKSLPEDEILRAEADMLAGITLPEMSAEDNMPAQSAQIADELDDFEEEPFSLRTRSMAEVLAEQGDIKGALDIYQELAAAATSPDEAEDIQRRITTLSARLTVVNASPAFKAADAEAAARSKEKLIGMLEALAERVEARAAG